MTRLLRKLRLGPRLACCFLLILAMTIVIAVTAISGSRSARDDLARVVAQANQWLAQITEMRSQLVRQDVAARQLAVATQFDQAMDRMGALEAAHRGFGHGLRQLKPLAGDDEEVRLLAQLGTLAAGQVPHLARARASVDAYNPVQAARVLNVDMAEQSLQLMQRVDELVALQQRRFEQRLRAFAIAGAQSDRLIIAIALAAFGIAAVVAVALTRSIAQPLREAVGFAEAVAEGNLHAPLPATHRDEPGRLLEALGGMAAKLASATSALNRLASEDGLTGAHNRRYLEHALQERCSAARASQEPLSVLLFDVDHFKAYNDSFGHQAGDHCLRAIVEAVRHIGLRPNDVVARYGGEEFAIVLSACSHDGALAVAQRVGAAVRSLGLASAHGPHPTVTVSIGVASNLTPNDSEPADWLRAADEALYEAKRGGRDTVRGRMVERAAAAAAEPESA